MIPDVTQTVMNMSDLMQDNNSLDTYSKEFIAEFTLNAMNAHLSMNKMHFNYLKIMYSSNHTIQLNPFTIQQVNTIIRRFKLFNTTDSRRSNLK